MGNTQQRLVQKNPEKPHEQQQQSHHDDDDDDSTFTCEICIEPIESPTKKFKNKNRCVHPFCTDCIIKYIQVKIGDDNVAVVNCPAVNCNHSLDPLSCRKIVPADLFVKWCDLLCEKAVLGLEGCYCPNRSCSALVLNECGGSVNRSKCPNCKGLFCFRCKVRWHAGYRCEEAGEMRETNDVAFGVLAEKKKWMRCPNCRHFVEHIGGCSVVKCSQEQGGKDFSKRSKNPHTYYNWVGFFSDAAWCGINFCYNCGRRATAHCCGGPPQTQLSTCLLITFITIIVLPALYLLLGWLNLPDV